DAPGQAPSPLAEDIPGIRAALDTASEFASAVFTLLFTDFLDPFPAVTLQVAMLGGSGIFALLLEQILADPERHGQDPAAVRARLSRLYFDTGAAGRGPEAIAAV